jgi:tRNA(fMet)-specific endonuclease VapC
MICLDTNAVISALNQRTSPVLTRIEDAIASGATLAIASIVLFELWYGAAKSAQPERNRQRIADFLAGPIEVLPFESADAEEAGDIRAVLERAGTPIGPYDILVAAQARRRDALLVTANAREFARVPRLKFEDWASPH